MSFFALLSAVSTVMAHSMCSVNACEMTFYLEKEGDSCKTLSRDNSPPVS